MCLKRFRKARLAYEDLCKKIYFLFFLTFLIAGCSQEQIEPPDTLEAPIIYDPLEEMDSPDWEWLDKIFN